MVVFQSWQDTTYQVFRKKKEKSCKSTDSSSSQCCGLGPGVWPRAQHSPTNAASCTTALHWKTTSQYRAQTCNSKSRTADRNPASLPRHTLMTLYYIFKTNERMRLGDCDTSTVFLTYLNKLKCHIYPKSPVNVSVGQWIASNSFLCSRTNIQRKETV